jgi:hypothetical protein
MEESNALVVFQDKKIRIIWKGYGLRLEKYGKQ